MEWYKRNTDRALIGMAGLTLEERGAYNTILDLLYSRDGELPDDEELIVRHLGCDRRTWRRLKPKLIAKGKIWIVVPDDFSPTSAELRPEARPKLMAKRVEHTLEEAKKFSEDQSKRAKKRWKNKDAPMPSAAQPRGNALTETNTKTTTTTSHSASLPNAKDLFQALLDAANGNVADENQHPQAGEIKPIYDLLHQGFDLELDVLPAVRAIVPGMSKPLRTWAASFLIAEMRRLHEDRVNGRTRNHVNGDDAIDPRTGLPRGMRPDDHDAIARWNIQHGGEEHWRRLIDAWRKGAWFSSWGPEPGKKGCYIPENALIAQGIEPYRETQDAKHET